MNYFSLPVSIYFQENEENNIFYNNHYIFFFFIKSIIWVFFVALLYFEYRRKLCQTWFGLRGLWLFNGIEQLTKIVFIYIEFNPENSTPLKTLVFIQSCLSMILLYYSLFGSVDYELKANDNNTKDTKEARNTSNMRGSNSLQTNSFKSKLESKLIITLENYFNKKLINQPFPDSVKNDVLSVFIFIYRLKYTMSNRNLQWNLIEMIALVI